MLKVKKLHPSAKLPTRNEAEDLGYDLYALEDTVVGKDPVKVKTGISAVFIDDAMYAYEEDCKRRREQVGSLLCDSIEKTMAYVGLAPSVMQYGLIVKDRSSMAAKGLFTHAGVIDPSYTGEIIVVMTGQMKIVGELPSSGGKFITHEDFEIKAGDKIAQMVPIIKLTGSVVEVQDLGTKSDRGAGGFGSTGA